MKAFDALTQLWQAAALPAERLADVHLQGQDPVMPSSFAIGTAAQVSIAAAALAALQCAQQRGAPPQSVGVDMREALLECTGLFEVDGRTPPIWDPIAGLYPCGEAGGEWVRLHTNFPHHRDGVLRLLGLPEGPDTPRTAVAQALRDWRAEAFEQAAADAGLVVAAVRSFAQWDAHPHAAHVLRRPLVEIERIGDAPVQKLSALGAQDGPMAGVRVLDLTRILAGPVGGRTLAAYGADVMLINSPMLPNIASIAETSRGKRSVHLDLDQAAQREIFSGLLQSSHVMVQGYRPGGLSSRGFDPESCAGLRPGLIYVSLSAYGEDGPWGGRRGFDSLVQTATGFNLAEAQAAGVSEPRPMPVQILDYATGFLIAFGAAAALSRQMREGGSWHVRLSLARTAQWLRSMGRIGNAFGLARPDGKALLEASDSGFGRLRALPHAARFSRTPARWLRPSVPPGTDAPQWGEVVG